MGYVDSYVVGSYCCGFLNVYALNHGSARVDFCSKIADAILLADAWFMGDISICKSLLMIDKGAIWSLFMNQS